MLLPAPLTPPMMMYWGFMCGSLDCLNGLDDEVLVGENDALLLLQGVGLAGRGRSGVFVVSSASISGVKTSELLSTRYLWSASKSGALSSMVIPFRKVVDGPVSLGYVGGCAGFDGRVHFCALCFPRAPAAAPLTNFLVGHLVYSS